MVSDRQGNQADITLGSEKTETPKRTFSEEEVAKLVTEAKTSALADVGRLRAEANKALSAATAAEERIKAIEKARMEQELEAFKDDPPELARIREKQARIQAQSELVNVKQELTDKEERLRLLDEKDKQYTKERYAREIAIRLGVDADKLTKLARFTDGTQEAIEDIASDLPKKEKRVPLKSDSGATIGGEATFEQVRAAYSKNPRDPAIRQRYLELRKERKG